MNGLFLKGRKYGGVMLQAINNVLLIGNKTAEQLKLMGMFNPKIDISDYQVGGSDDKVIYDAIVALGWQDVFESDEGESDSSSLDDLILHI